MSAPRSARRPTAAERNRLWALSGHICAFPDCAQELTEISGTRYLTQGEIAHIRAHSPEGPRHDPSLPQHEVDSYANTILLCRKHHRIVDSDESTYTVDILLKWKREHEDRFASPVLTATIESHVLSAPPLTEPHIPRPHLVHAVELQASGGASRIALVGISGAGKSQLATEILEASEDYVYRWWVRGSDRQLLLADISRIGAFLGFSLPEGDAELAAREVRALLQSRNDWLIVVDDLIDLELLHSLPSGPGLILITTQRAGVLAWEEVEIPPFDLNDSKQLLSTAPRLNDADDATLSKIAERCLGLPIVLAQVAAYSSVTGLPAQDQLVLLESVRGLMLERGHLTSHATLSASIRATLERLTQDSRKLLSLMAAFAEAPIPTIVFTAAFSPPPEGSEQRLRFEDSIGELRAYSLVSRDSDTVSIHGLTREVVNVMEERQVEPSTQSAAVLVSNSLPIWADRADNWPLMEALLPHATKLLASFEQQGGDWLIEYGTLCNKVGVYYRARGLSAKAKDVMLGAIERVRNAEPVHDTLGLLGSLLQNTANTLADLGEDQLAVTAMRESLEIKERTFGPDHMLTAIAHSGLGNLLESLAGNSDQALEEYEEALRVYRTTGLPHLIADALTDIARLCYREDSERALSNLAEAQSLAERDREGWAVLCTVHTWRSRILASIGQVPNAAREAHAAVTIAEQHAPDSKELGDALSCLGDALCDMGLFRAARKHRQRCLEISGRVGTTPLTLATRVGDLGLTMAAMGESAGIGYLEESLADLSALLPSGHATVRTAQRMLIQGLIFVGDSLKAKRLAEAWADDFLFDE